MSFELKASRYSGCGNDFLLLDNRQNDLPPISCELMKRMCACAQGIDGLILVESAQTADAAMRFYNADGKEAEMCGNGVRCLMQFLRQKLHYPRTRCLLKTQKKEIVLTAEEEAITVQMGRVEEIHWEVSLQFASERYSFHYVDSGVPHICCLVPDVEKVDVANVGSYFRHHPHFAPRGTNVNFLSIAPSHVDIRTFERGVERETLACGTGCVASAYVLNKLKKCPSPITFRVRSQEWLSVENEQGNMTLKGPARWISDHSFTIDLNAQSLLNHV